MPKKDTAFERIERALFKDNSEASQMLSPVEMEIKQRLMLCVSRKMDDPLIDDSELVNFLVNGCGGAANRISKSQAYRDIAMVHRLVGNVQLAAKSWYRYMIVEGAKKAYQVAINANDAKGAAAALDKIGKYTRADKEDDQFDFSTMIPPSLEPSDDVTLEEGLEEIPNIEEARRAFRSRFKKDATDIHPVEEN